MLSVPYPSGNPLGKTIVRVRYGTSARCVEHDAHKEKGGGVAGVEGSS